MESMTTLQTTDIIIVVEGIDADGTGITRIR
jgi:hypothetical protein